MQNSNTGSLRSLEEREFELLSRYITQHTGIVIPPEKSYLIETRLTGVMVSTGTRTFRELCEYLQSDAEPAIRHKIINAITTNETMWFRDRKPWKVLEDKILPDYIDLIRKGRKNKIRIWFAAVSTGQEAYSTIMCIDDYLKSNRIYDITLSDFDFIATDISSNVLEIAGHGKYDQISIMRGLDEYYKSKYFIKNGSVWDIDDSIRNAVKLSEFNLLDSYYTLGTFDIIFCRYVMIYFSEDTNRKIVKKMHDSLEENGIFFSGNYIFYDLLSEHFDAIQYGDYTYYSRKAR